VLRAVKLSINKKRRQRDHYVKEHLHCAK